MLILIIRGIVNLVNLKEKNIEFDRKLTAANPKRFKALFRYAQVRDIPEQPDGF